MDFESFIQNIESLKIVVSDQMKQQFLSYKSLIQEVNKVLNLTAIDDDHGIYLKHFYDSLLIAPLIKENSSLIDIGSGAGFPGLVLAIARPDIHITCVEPTTKRTNFLAQVVEACGLTNVTIINDRAENIIDEHRERYDYATARAVAYLDILSELCLPFVRIDGTFIAMKGAKALEEIEVSQKALNILGGKLETSHRFYDDEMGERYNLEIRKIKKTPQKFPRNYAKIKKAPLSGRNHD